MGWGWVIHPLVARCEANKCGEMENDERERGGKNMHLRLSPKKIKVEKKRNGVCGDQKANKWRR